MGLVAFLAAGLAVGVLGLVAFLGLVADLGLAAVVALGSFLPGVAACRKITFRFEVALQTCSEGKDRAARRERSNSRRRNHCEDFRRFDANNVESGWSNFVVTLAFFAATGFLAAGFLAAGFFSASLSLKEALTRTSLPEAARAFSC